MDAARDRPAGDRRGGRALAGRRPGVLGLRRHGGQLHGHRAGRQRFCWASPIAAGRARKPGIRSRRPSCSRSGRATARISARSGCRFHRDPLATSLEARRSPRACSSRSLNLAWLVGDAQRRRRLVPLPRRQRGICPSVRLSELGLEPGRSSTPRCDTRSSSGWPWSGRSVRLSCSFRAELARLWRLENGGSLGFADGARGPARAWARISWSISESPAGAFTTFRPC